MNTAALICTGMATIAVYAGGYHLVMYLKLRSGIKYLSFACLCFSVGVYELFSTGLYTATAIEQGIFWQRLQLESIPLIVLSMTWLIGIYTGRVSRPLLKTVAGGAVLMVLLSRLLPAEYTLSVNRPSIRHLAIPGWFDVTYFEAEIGVIYLVMLAAMIALYLYLLTGLAVHFRRSKEPETLSILASQFPLFLAAANDSLVAAQAYRFVYLTEFAFIFIIVAMSYVLFGQLMRLYNALEKSNHNLEDKVNERTAQILKLNNELQRAADIDGLTGAYNRRFLDRYLELETRRAVAELTHRQGGDSPEPAMNFGLAIFDIDDFKQINDEYGHIAGDNVLAGVAERVRKNIFERDLLCRYGGEEFVVIFTRTSRQGIVDAAEKLREAVGAAPFMVEKGKPPLGVTVSVGVASFADVDQPTAKAILLAADECLLAAKRMGKNRVLARKIFPDSALLPGRHVAGRAAV